MQGLFEMAGRPLCRIGGLRLRRLDGQSAHEDGICCGRHSGLRVRGDSPGRHPRRGVHGPARQPGLRQTRPRAARASASPRHLAKRICREAVRFAAQSDPKVLIEAAIVGREIECGVLAGARRRAGGGIGCRPRSSSTSGSSSTTFKPSTSRTRRPSRCPPIFRRRHPEIQELAVAAYEVLDCAGLARVDVFACPDGSVVMNELNTMPGFTATSGYPVMWAASASEILLPVLVARIGLVQDAVQPRRPDRAEPIRRRHRARLLAERAQARSDSAERPADREFRNLVDAGDGTNIDDEHDPEGATIAFERAQVAALIDQTMAPDRGSRSRA